MQSELCINPQRSSEQLEGCIWPRLIGHDYISRWNYFTSRVNDTIGRGNVRITRCHIVVETTYLVVVMSKQNKKNAYIPLGISEKHRNMSFKSLWPTVRLRSNTGVTELSSRAIMFLHQMVFKIKKQIHCIMK